MWKCPKCGEPMHDYDDHCWNCRTRNPDMPEPDGQDGIETEKKAEEASADTPTAARRAPGMKKCPYCSEEIRSDAIKCRYCLSIIPEARKDAGLQGENGRDEISVPKKAAIAIVAVIMLIAAVWAAVVLIRPLSGLFGSGKDPSSSVDRKVAYEEIAEYDGKGNVTKSVKTYPQSKDKDKQ